MGHDTPLVGFDLDFATCFEVDQDLIERALAPARSLTEPAPRQKVFALIERMALVARPRQGISRLLTVFARLAECSWLEGELEILLCDLGEATGIDVMLHDGLSFVRLHPPIRVSVPFNEFATAYERDPAAFAPLQQAPADLDVLRLRATEAELSQGARSAAELPAADEIPDPPSTARALELTSKPTVRMPRLQIPREAYRDGQPPESRPRPDLAEPPPTAESAGGPAEPASAADEMPPTKRVVDDIDEGWE